MSSAAPLPFVEPPRFRGPLLDAEALAEAARVPGATHSFLKQVATAAPETGAAAGLQALFDGLRPGLPTALGERWQRLLPSLDNRRFFQAVAEALALDALRGAGLAPTGLRWPEAAIELADRPVDGGAVAGPPALELVVLGVVRGARPEPDAAQITRLVAALDRVGSRSRICLLVRRWLPHDFDPEPVRRAIELWLREVDRGGWDGRYAAYDDENVSLEFALTGEQRQPRAGAVSFALPPVEGHHTLDRVMAELLGAADAWRQTAPRDGRPLLLTVVSDQPLNLSPGGLRELLYGKAVEQSTGPEGLQLVYGPEYAASLFRDPLQQRLAGLLLLERQRDLSAPPAAHLLLNPWCQRQLGGRKWPFPTTAATRWAGDRPVVSAARHGLRVSHAPTSG